ncbi:MAG TPA: hypothetical protein PLL20_07300 [Phycisphaerae bacterium]|nr:hypothetical protein [Phycisphaerae bacterium]HRR85298.1 hypothetical protein [Phycisphaerae bacterium]
MRRTTVIGLACAVTSSVVALAQDAPASRPGDVPQCEIVSVKRIWDAAPHNAFTDLIRFQDKWYCTFREGEGHVGGDGKLRVLESVDGDKWSSAALLTEEGVDLRDPKLSITADGRLMMVAGGSIYKGKELVGRPGTNLVNGHLVNNDLLRSVAPAL